jgi:OmpA-OmpF porin, OOP family
MVNNPSFENYTSCPSGSGELNAINWQVTANSGLSSPDYFNTCVPSTNSYVRIPNNLYGSQIPYDGNAYTGIFCYGNNSMQREYMQTQLTSPMVAGQNYHVSFRVSLADNFGTAIGSLGAHLSNNPLLGSGNMQPINVLPQIVSSEIITNQTVWTEIAGDYIALGGEQYLTIGNYLADELTPKTAIIPIPQFSIWAYYYIDLVSVTANPLDVNEFNNASIKIYPNPLNDILYLDYADINNWKNMTIYSADGKLVMKPSKILQIINLTELPQGIYYLIIHSQDGSKNIKKIVKI